MDSSDSLIFILRLPLKMRVLAKFGLGLRTPEPQTPCLPEACLMVELPCFIMQLSHLGQRQTTREGGGGTKKHMTLSSVVDLGALLEGGVTKRSGRGGGEKWAGRQREVGCLLACCLSAELEGQEA